MPGGLACCGGGLVYRGSPARRNYPRSVQRIPSLVELPPCPLFKLTWSPLKKMPTLMSMWVVRTVGSIGQSGVDHALEDRR